MSSYAISGKPGGGKTLYAVSKILEELINGERTVVTNVALKLSEINAHLQKKHPKKSIDLFKRVRILTDEEVRKFYLYRSEGHDIEDISKEDWKAGKRLNYSNAGSAVLYVLDEIHIFLNARAWMETGEGVLFYMSQHRKLGDDVIWITQAIQNVDKQFRSVTQDYTYVRNLRKEKFLKYFRRGEGFERKTYLEPYTGNQKPTDSVRFNLDPEISSCYDTSAGIGIHNRGAADAGEKVRGIKMKWLWGSIAGIFALLLIFAFFFPKIIAFLCAPKVSQNLPKNKVEVAATSIASKPASFLPNLSLPSLPTLPIEEKSVYSFYVFKNRPPPTELLSNFLDGVTAKIDYSNNTVYLAGPPGKLSVVQNFLKTMDIQTPQIRLNFILCTASLSEEQSFSLEWIFDLAAGAGGPNFMSLLKAGSSFLASGKMTDALELSVQAAAKKGKLNVVTRPQLFVQSGQTAMLNSGRQVAVPTTTLHDGVTTTSVDYKNVALEIKATPQLLSDGLIQLKIEQKNDDIARMVQIDGNQVPELSTQSLNTSVLMHSGDWVSVGGVTVLSKNKTKTGIPWLIDLPIIGAFFGKTETSNQRLELGILVQAEVVQLNEEIRKADPVETQESEFKNPKQGKDEAAGMPRGKRGDRRLLTLFIYSKEPLS